MQREVGDRAGNHVLAIFLLSMFFFFFFLNLVNMSSRPFLVISFPGAKTEGEGGKNRLSSVLSRMALPRVQSDDKVVASAGTPGRERERYTWQTPCKGEKNQEGLSRDILEPINSWQKHLPSTEYKTLSTASIWQH